MCLPITNQTMTIWLERQVRMVEAWREEIAARPEIDMGMAMRVERHYQWLTTELAALERSSVRLH